jgi:hypothetical protein
VIERESEAKSSNTRTLSLKKRHTTCNLVEDRTRKAPDYGESEYRQKREKDSEDYQVCDPST